MHNFGTVDSFNDARGFGFLVSKDGDRVFCHRTGINRKGYKTLTEGEQVTFDVEEDAAGRFRATNVQPIGTGMTR